MIFVRLLIRLYQIILSPLIAFVAGPGAGCRFEPTCSHFFLEACETHGVSHGSWLGLKRIGRCHPWGGNGYDPVPERLPIDANAKSGTCPIGTRHPAPGNT